MGLFDIIPDTGYSVQHFVLIFLCSILIVLFVQVTFKVIRLTLSRLRQDELYKDIPGPPEHWLFGYISQVKTPNDFIRMYKDWVAEYGPVRKAHFGPWKIEVSLCDPDFIQCVMKTSEPKEPLVYNFLKPWIGDGLLLSKGQKWARSRRLLTPAFHFEILKPYIGIFEHSAQIMVDKWKRLLKEGKPSIEMFENVSLMTLHSLLKCTFGFDSECQTEGRKNPYIKAVYDLSELIIQRLTNPVYQIDWLYYISPGAFKFRKACNVVHKYSRDVIHSRRKQLQENDNVLLDKKYLDFIDLLLAAKDEDGQGMTDEEIQDEVDTFMFEGHDTTASGLSWFFYNMARHPEYQQKCREEIQRVLEDSENISWDQLHEMDFLTMCIKESLRLHPPVPSVGRKLTRRITLPNGITLHPDVYATLAIYSVHHNPKVWPDPEVYNPSRFSPENTKRHSPYALIPFSAGPRNCIGQHFAMNELKTTAATILRNFELSVDESIPVVLWPELILRSKDGIWLKVKEISK